MNKLHILLNCKKVVTVLWLGISTVSNAGQMGDNEQHTICKKPPEMRDGAPMPPAPGFMPPPSMPPFLFGLKLTEVQNDKIFTFTYLELPKMHERMKQRMQLMKSIRTISKADKFDEGQVKTIAEKLANIEKEELISKLLIENKIFQILTPEQRSQVLKAEIQDEPTLIPMD